MSETAPCAHPACSSPASGHAPSGCLCDPTGSSTEGVHTQSPSLRLSARGKGGPTLAWDTASGSPGPRARNGARPATASGTGQHATAGPGPNRGSGRSCLILGWPDPKTRSRGPLVRGLGRQSLGGAAGGMGHAQATPLRVSASDSGSASPRPSALARLGQGAAARSPRVRAHTSTHNTTHAQPECAPEGSVPGGRASVLTKEPYWHGQSMASVFQLATELLNRFIKVSQVRVCEQVLLLP
jgi:hypothetical protein